VNSKLITVIHNHQIVVLRDGYIAELGNHEKLMEKKGHYFDLFNKQMGVFGNNGFAEKQITENLTPV
jgi:ABC-type multidrug transport system fused ATPase/permease subunit